MLTLLPVDSDNNLHSFVQPNTFLAVFGSESFLQSMHSASFTLIVRFKIIFYVCIQDTIIAKVQFIAQM